ncbi:hypothetical protein CRG98_037487 [Punica granatum]|uniref:Uncharacterized protein n=1 Tax=Punica granatum TaxID=22663 RepID=A0A2I0IDG1_PUNGR|nr:hypothetical protein CRG98_037487 [Punica granatum]
MAPKEEELRKDWIFKRSAEAVDWLVKSKYDLKMEAKRFTWQRGLDLLPWSKSESESETWWRCPINRCDGGHVCNVMLNLDIQTVRLLLRIPAYIHI